MVANLRYGGAQVVDGALQLYNNPKHLENLTSQAIGSLVTLGPMTKGLSYVGKGLAATKYGAKLAPYAEGAAFNTAVGLQEAGGAYGEVIQRVMALDHPTLMRQSEGYRDLINQGYSERDAKVQLAMDAAQIAAPTAFGTGFVTSKLAPREFELGILGQGAKKTLAQSLRALPGTAAREFIEETPQSAAGQFAANLALQQTVDPFQPLGENVAEVGIQGGIASLGVGPILKGPGIIAKTLAAPVKLGYEQLAKRAGRVKAANESSSNVSTENISEDIQSVAKNSGSLAEGLRSLVEESETARQVAEQAKDQTDQVQGALDQVQRSQEQDTGANPPAPLTDVAAVIDVSETAPVITTPEARAQEAEEFIQKVETSATLRKEDIETLPSQLTKKLTDLQSKLDQTLTRFDAMIEMAKIVEDPNASVSDQASAAVFIADIINQNRDLFSGELPAFLQNTPHDNPHFKALIDTFRNLQRMEKNPMIADAIRFAQDELNIPDVDLDTVGSTSPEGLQTIRNVIGAATHAPARLNENVANQVLRQADEGKAKISPEELATIRNALALQVEAAKAQPKVEQVEVKPGPAAEALSTQAPTPAAAPKPRAKTTTQDFVAKQIETEGGDEKHQLSLRQHVSEINRAIKNKKPRLIKEKIQNLVDFAKSQTNKVIALNESIAKGDGSNAPYQAINSKGKFYTNKTGVGVKLGNPGSENFARQVHKEATSLVDLANQIINQHPEAKIEPLPTPPALNLPEEGSTTTQQETPPSATTSKTAATEQLEPPSVPATGGVPGAIDTTAPTTQTSAPAELTPEEKAEQKKLQDPKQTSDDELINRVKFFDRQEKQSKTKTLSPNATKSLKAIHEEIARRKALKIEPVKEETPPSVTEPATSATGQSRFTPEELRSDPEWEQDESLSDEMDRIEKKEKLTPDDEATIEALQKEMDRRYDEAIIQEEQEQTPPVEQIVEQTPTKKVIKSKRKPKTVAKSLQDLSIVLETKPTEPETKPKLEPVEEAVEEPVGAEPESIPLDQAYENLAESSEGNYFLKAYKRGKKIGSRLMTVKSPLAAMRKALSGQTALAQFAGGDARLPRRLPIWQEFLTDTANKITTNFKTRMYGIINSKVDENGNPKTSFLDLMDQGSPYNRYMNYKTMNLLEKVDGVYGLNKQLLESGVLAAMDWLLNVQDRTVNHSAERLAAVLGVDENLIEQRTLDEWNRGIGLSEAKRSLAQQLKKFWDVQDNKDVSETYVQGVAEAMALELLVAMEQTGLLKNGEFAEPTLTEKTYNMVYFDRRSDDDKALLNKLGEERNTISDLALVDKLRSGRSVGEPITEVPQHLLYNPNVSTTNQQKKAAGNVQATRHMTNMPMVNFMRALGLQNYINALGGRLTDPRVTDPEKTNINDARSKAGANLQLTNSYNGMLAQVAEVEAYSERTGIPVSEVPTFFEYAVLSIGRLQMRGLFNGQADKLARNIVTPVRAKIDLSQPGSRKFSDFMQAIGQGLGAKPESKSRRAVTAAAFEKLKFYRPIIDGIKVHLRDEKKGSLSQDTIDALVNLAPEDKLTDHGLQSLLDYARYEVLRESNHGDLTRFESWNFLEADGKTNGPINALMLWAAGAITPRFLDLVNKGGMFFGANDKTLDQHGDTVDLYKASGNKASEKVGQLHAAIRDDNNPKVLAQFNAFRRIMTALNTNIVLKGDQIEISRGFVKNPLTITVYGSGANGIAIKATKELTEFIYQKLSESLQTGVVPGDLIYKDYPDNSFHDDLSLLLSRTPDISKDKKFGTYYFTRPVKHVAFDRKGKPGSDEFLKNFTFSKTEFDALRDNVQFFLTDPMVSAITDEVMKEIAPVIEAIQQATQIQSIVVRNMFRNKVFAKLADKQINPNKYPNYHKGDFLSQNELNEIFNSLKQFMAVIDTGTQRYQINSHESADVFAKATITYNGQSYNITMPESFARSLSGDMKAPIFMNTPNLAGVKAIPYLNIGSGDGQMMLHGMSIDIHRSDISRRTLPVFDGLNMPIDMILEYSRLINESVFKTWTQNSPMRAIAESFRTFAENRPIQQVLDPDNGLNQTIDDTILEMSKIEGGFKPEKLIDQTSMEMMINDLVRKLEDFAGDLEDRQQVYRETTQSIDQMSSGKGPHNVKGTGALILVPGMSNQEIAHAMEARRIELSNIRAGHRKTAQTAPAVALIPASTPVAQLTPAMQKVLALGTEDVSGTRVIQADQLPDVIRALGSTVDSQFARQLVKAIAKEYRLVFGTPTQLDNWERSNNVDRFQPGSNDNAMGKIDPVAKVILISNLVPETIIHELIHAATIDKVRAYYSNPRSLSQEDRDAIRRIEGLMNEWLTLDFTNNDEIIVNAHQMAQSSILGWMRKGVAENEPNKYMAEAINEFMAWTLSNQELRNKARTLKNSAFRILKDTLEALKAWFGKSLRVPNNLLAQLQFNTRILISTPTDLDNLKTDANSVTLFQSPTFGNSDRLTYFRERFKEKILTYINEGDPNTLEGYRQRYQRSNEIRAARQASRDLTIGFVRQFGDLRTMQAWATFYEMQVGLMTELQLNPNSLARMQELYDHVISKLEVTDFRINNDPNDQADEAQAQGKYDAIHGLLVKKTDPYGRSSLLSSFVSLAMSSDIFRGVLAKIDKPPTDKSTTTNTMDRILEDAGNASIDWLSLMASGEKSKAHNVQEAMDNLASAMIENVGDQRSAIEQQTHGFFSGADRYFYDNMQALTQSAIQKSNQVLATSNSKVARAGAKLLKITSRIINEKSSTAIAQGFVNNLAKLDGQYEIMAIANDIVLRTDENAPIYDMIAETKATAEQTRQRYRDELPEELASEFSRPLTQEEWTAQHKVAQTDIASLKATYGAAGAVRMIFDAAYRSAEIRAKEAFIRAQEGTRAAKILEKAKQLAGYLNTGELGLNLLPNTYAISKLNGEVGFNRSTPDPQTENAVDELVTLYAIRGLSQETKDTIINLGNENQKNKEGLEFVFHYLVGQRKDELDKAKATQLGKNNYYKGGGLPSEQVGNDSLVIESDREHANMLKKGYVHQGAYTGSSADQNLTPRSYYYSPTAGLAPYRQGVMQTVHVTASGIDPQTGYTVGRLMAGRIVNGREIAQVQQQLRNQAGTNENLRLVYEDDGSVIAMERMADVNKTNTIERNTNLSEMIGAWRGRQVEEIFATEINRALVNELYTIWEKARQEGRTNEFVNIFTSTDPVIQNTAKLVPNLMRDHIKQKFGRDTFMVHRSMALNALGDRQASVSDMFTGETRWNPAVQKRFETIAIGLFGNSAYNGLVNTERTVQNIITNVKYNIIVKSVIIPAGNIMSNFGQLLNRDVPLRDILTGVPKKIIEINSYIKSRNQEIKLEAQLRAAEGKGDLNAIRKLKDRLQAMEDSYKRLSIYPLIKAGEFSTISNGNVTAEDLALADGKWSNFMDKLIAKIPDGPLRTTARYGLVTRDTALFQALAKAVQYGDFVGKAILYDDLTKRQKVANKEAIATVNQAFVPYNNLSGRGRHYLESLGLLWFYNYKLRVMKESVYLLRHHPFRALVMMGIPGLNGIDSPLDSNFLTNLINGRLGASVGPEMAFDSWTLNPWVNGFRTAF
jgi:hypothetical protein